MQWMVGLLLSFCVGSVPTVFAASAYQRSLNQKSNLYMKNGVFIGGQAGTGSSLLGVRRAFSGKAKMERVIMDLGDAKAQATSGPLGYFQVGMDQLNNRVVIDLAQLQMSKVSEAKLKQIFKASPYVAGVNLTLDQEDRAATMVLQLKRPARLEVFQLHDPKKPGRIVMDIIPANPTVTR